MPELILLIGLPGSGKDYYCSKNFEYERIFLNKTYILSSDNIRKELYGDENDQTHNAEVFQYIKEQTVNMLSKGMKVVINATNLTRKARNSITQYVDENLQGFYDYGLIRYIIIATPYYKCLENNRKRDRQVPDNVIERMYKNFEFPTYNEFVHKIDIVYPFELDKKMYDLQFPYKRLLNFEHKTPYHTKTVGEHMEETAQIMKNMTEDKVLNFAAALHDIGKPFCQTFTDEGIAHYYNHANVGSYEAMFYGKARKYSDNEIITLCNLIQFHMRAHDCVDNEKATKKLKNIVGENLYYKLQLLRIADKEAH